MLRRHEQCFGEGAISGREDRDVLASMVPGLDLDELLLSTWVLWYEMSGVPLELYNAWGLKSLV